MNLQNKVALITGAGGPMGQAIAKRFYEGGASLVLTDISERRLLETVKLLKEKEGGGISYLRVNALNYHEMKEVVDQANKMFDRIDILINVVGGIRAKQMTQSLLEMDSERWRDTMELNLNGGINCIKLLAPKMLENKYGKIVNISSINYAGEPGVADYGAAKAAVVNLTRTAAMELSPYINVNCIAPGLIQTSVLERVDEEEQEKYSSRTLLKRLGKPSDIANTAFFLASDESAYITGEVIAVSGGIWPHL